MLATVQIEENARHALAEEHLHLTLLSEATLGLDDVEAERVVSVEDSRAKYGR